MGNHGSFGGARRLSAVLLLLLALVATLVVAVLRSQRQEWPEVRAIWVTRSEYRSPEDVRRIMLNLADAGFTDVFFQIRGNGTVFYPSRMEPWACELSGDKVAMLGADPGWNPLQTAIDEAHVRGLRLHAYMNVLPGWRGLSDPPARAGQLWTAHPDWFMVDSLGQKMLPTKGWYAFLNPVLPDVRSHLLGLVREIAGYNVDGIHLDYIRYPHDYELVAGQRYPGASESELRRHADFSYDPLSLALLRERFGDDPTGDQIANFRRESVTTVVRDIAYLLRSIRPDGILLSASVMGNPIDGRRRAYQDSTGWVKSGLIDWAVQMDYGTTTFQRYLDAMRKGTGRRRFRSSVVVGLNCRNGAEDLLRQVELVEKYRPRGFSLFSYSLLFDKAQQPTETGRLLLPRLRSISRES